MPYKKKHRPRKSVIRASFAAWKEALAQNRRSPRFWVALGFPELQLWVDNFESEGKDKIYTEPLQAASKENAIRRRSNASR